MNPTLAVVLLVAAFALVGLLGLRFLATETRRFHEEHDELERKYKAAGEAAERALRESQRWRPGVN